jgi:type I restriction enzyme M protein
MDSNQLQNKLKSLCKVMWTSNISDPITYVTQISYLLFLKMLEEMDYEQKEAQNGNYRTLFGKYKDGDEELDFDLLRWSILTSNPDNEAMLRILRDTLPFLARHPKLSQGAKAVFRDASIVIPDGKTLKTVVDIINPISFLSMDADVKGDLFEYLASELGGQKKAAQFRTPRHLIRVVTQMVDPQIRGTICDPACGSGGFLIAAYEHILLANTSPEFVNEKVSADGTVRKIGIGDKLSRAQWDFLQTGAFYGFEGDYQILRMAAMNAVLHGFDRCPIIKRDSICGSEDKWDEIQFDYILENPPFSGSRGDAKRSLRIEKGDKYVLFLAHALRSLRPNGTAGIIFPNGILFGDTTSHLTVKARLLREFDLQAVVILPKGMFEPYTPNPTCFFIFRKTGRPTENVWFFKVDGDGSTLSKARKFDSQYRNDFPDLLAMWPERETEDGRAWLVPVQRIIDNGYNMTISGLGLIEAETIEHLEPEEILASIADKEERILELICQMQELLTGGNGE